MERLTGIVEDEIKVRAGNVVPICPNSAPGRGNCFGMVKYNTCPQTRGAKGKFPECTKYIEEFGNKCCDKKYS